MGDEGEEGVSPTPDVPTADVTPDVPTPVEAPPAKPTRWFLVEYRALAGAELPLEAAGKWWHANSQHILAEPCFAKVAKIAGFRAIKDVPQPENTAGCAECGG